MADQHIAASRRTVREPTIQIASRLSGCLFERVASWSMCPQPLSPTVGLLISTCCWLSKQNSTVIRRANLLWHKLIWNLDNTATKAIFHQQAMILECVRMDPAGNHTTGHQSHKQPPPAAQSERVIRKRRRIKPAPGLWPWEQPTSCLPLNSQPRQQLHLSVSQSGGSVFPQPGIVENPAPRGDRQGLWPVALHQEVSTDKIGAKIKARDQPSVSVSPHNFYEIGLCALGVSAARHGSWLCVWRVLSRALDHAVKWKVLVHDHKPSRK